MDDNDCNLPGTSTNVEINAKAQKEEHCEDTLGEIDRLSNISLTSSTSYETTTQGRTDGRTDERTDRRTDERTDDNAKTIEYPTTFKTNHLSKSRSFKMSVHQAMGFKRVNSQKKSITPTISMHDKSSQTDDLFICQFVGKYSDLFSHTTSDDVRSSVLSSRPYIPAFFSSISEMNE